jgi:hypothetical protein
MLMIRIHACDKLIWLHEGNSGYPQVNPTVHFVKGNLTGPITNVAQFISNTYCPMPMDSRLSALGNSRAAVTYSTRFDEQAHWPA